MLAVPVRAQAPQPAPRAQASARGLALPGSRAGSEVGLPRLPLRPPPYALQPHAHAQHLVVMGSEPRSAASQRSLVPQQTPELTPNASGSRNSHTNTGA